jgi:hypothetical protein
MTRYYSQALGALLCVAMLAACSGGGSVPSSSSPSVPASHQRTGFIKAQVFVPRKKHQSAREKLKTEQRRHAHGRKPKFLSGNTTEIDFELLSVGGVTATSGDRTAFDFVVYTNGSDCTASGGGFLCTITAAAPAGSDVYDISSRQCSQSSGTGNPCPGGDLTVLGAAVAPIAVIFDQTVAAAFTLNPVVASIAWSAVGSANYNNGSSNGVFPSSLWLASNGSNLPTYTPSGTVGQPGTYSCAGNNCYEPAAQGTEIAYGVTLQAYDPSSALIIPASGGGTIYQTPLYLTSSGAPDVITWSCTDHVVSGTSLTWATGGGPFASNGSATGANASINSPVANPASDIDGGSTFDGNGNPVTAVGNNGTQMSWDGVDQPKLDSPDTCTATDTESNSAVFYVGLGEGGVTWGNAAGPGNVYVADENNSAVKEILAVNGSIPASPTITTLGSGFIEPVGVAVDTTGNVYVVDYGNSTIDEMLAVGGSIPVSPTINTLGSGFNLPQGIAVDGSGDVYVADSSNNAVKEIVAVGGSIPASPTIRTLGSGFNSPLGVAVDASGNVYVADAGSNAVKEILAVGGSIPASPTIKTLASGFNRPYSVAVR